MKLALELKEMEKRNEEKDRLLKKIEDEMRKIPELKDQDAQEFKEFIESLQKKLMQ
jgi:hypothetical protein